MWLNIFLEHCGLTFSEKQPMFWMSHLRHLTSRGERQEFLKNQNPIPSTCFELGTQNKWSFGSRLLPNISIYSDVEVVWPPEKSKLFRNVKHQRKTFIKAYLIFNYKEKKKCGKADSSYWNRKHFQLTQFSCICVAELGLRMAQPEVHHQLPAISHVSNFCQKSPLGSLCLYIHCPAWKAPSKGQGQSSAEWRKGRRCA